MKSQFDKFGNSDEALESALRDSAPRSEFPPDLHNSIMNAIHSAHRAESTSVSVIEMLQSHLKARWLPVTGFAALVVVGVLLTIYNRPVPTIQNPQPLSEISNAFSTSQELVDSLPSVAVGPLSEELDKVNRDLDRTAEFLIATLP
jgi:hypothetical protein